MKSEMNKLGYRIWDLGFSKNKIKFSGGCVALCSLCLCGNIGVWGLVLTNDQRLVTNDSFVGFGV